MRIIVADDQIEVRAALQLALQHHHPGWACIEITSLEGLLREIEQGCPDLLIVDWGMRGMLERDALPNVHWENVLAAIRRRCPYLGIIVMDTLPDTRTAALRAGASAFICKADPPEMLLETLRAMETGIRRSA
jgi:DNA-binding NarL/FixJ family response regulator